GHSRLVTRDIRGDRFGVVVSERTASAGDLARPGRHLAFDSVRLPNGETWLLIARDGMRDADIVAFDGVGRPTRRIDMGEDADPFDIEVWRGRVWVSDGTRYRFDSVTVDGDPRFGEVEDAAFRAELEEAREAPRLWKRLRLASQLALVAIPILGILIIR